MAQINFILQGKGGVGKSVCAVLLAQYKKSKSTDGKQPVCIDLDPVNTSFKSFKAFNVQHFNILDSEENIKRRSFDSMIEEIFQKAEEGQDSIIDVGAMTFLPLSSYIKNTDVFTSIAGEDENGNPLHEIYVHVPVVAGQMFNDTIQGLQTVLDLPGPFQVIVWLNPMNGAVEEKFTQAKIEHKKLGAIVTLPVLTEDTFGHDFRELLESKHTFEEALKDEKLFIVVRSRLKRIQKLVYEAIDCVKLI